LALLPWGDEAAAFRARVALLRREGDGGPDAWPDLGDEALLAAAEDWLLPHLVGRRGLADLGRLDLVGILAGLLDHRQRRELDRLAPTHVTVPTGSRVPVDYGEDPPVLAVRLQELFGLAETPAVNGGRTPLLLHLLSPARRPVAVTRDLAAFWRGSYAAVRKELRGRYPRHPWPDDPLAAAPTRHAKPRAT
jgi:ATP-dependent helicase HrpB